jgi:hypothetical protein
MAFVAVPACIKMEFFYTMNGQPAMNRIHISTTESEPTEATCLAFAQAGVAWWAGNVPALVAPTFSLREVHTVSLAAQNAPQAVVSEGLPIVGTNGGASLPNNVAIAISLRTGLTGRSARGRWFWGGLTETQVVANEVDGGVLVSIVSAIDNLLSAITDEGGEPVIVSYVSGGAPRGGGPVKFIITDALAVDAIVDSQRGRLH